jgi:hypothetical protein
MKLFYQLPWQGTCSTPQDVPASEVVPLGTVVASQ